MSTLVTLRVPNDLLEQIDGTAKLEGMSRSQVMISLMRDQDPRPTKTESEAIVKVKEKAERAREPKKEAKSAIEVVVSSECPHGWPTKRMCNFNSGGCKPW